MEYLSSLLNQVRGSHDDLGSLEHRHEPHDDHSVHNAVIAAASPDPNR
ncbi:hypothetical protein RvY_05083 [Ramazzottius varieornatus]|uniref:Uncharacterized protein n=1 Tax=Ramazzottius varieornatus TaxID=947166 RepID=A0A1D1UXC5_RAMVA|nr:hypothetical protein RvY_05083 [Ramazzottius varieornatus]